MFTRAADHHAPPRSRTVLRPPSALLLTFLLAGAALFGWRSAAAQQHAAHSEQPSVVAAGELREFVLTAAPLKWEIQPGLVVDGWGYNGTVPGPELRVREGDTVRVLLRNRLPVPTTIHWHGIDVPLNMDGVPGVSQEMVAPGADFLYEFPAIPAGSRWYHSHVDSSAQLELGLYGTIIVEPLEPTVIYDRDLSIVLDEKALDFTPDVALGNARLRNLEGGNGRGGALFYDVFLMNGKAGDAIPPLEIAEGERMLIRLLNAGTLPHAIHLHGQSFTIVATDGNPVPPGGRLLKDTVLLGPGERYDLEVLGERPGVWMFHCHMPNHQDNGMMTALVYNGFEVPRAHHPPAASSPAAPAPLATPQPVAASPSGSRIEHRVLDNRFDPSALTIPVGTTVSWTNLGTNLHTATAFDARFDSGTLLPGGAFAFTFNTPGEYGFFCRQHLLNGMVGRIIVK